MLINSQTLSRRLPESDGLRASADTVEFTTRSFRLRYLEIYCVLTSEKHMVTPLVLEIICLS